ncbi:hypothetical protein LF1_29830 [Rubripirellula obstinata]|uniref:Transporter n=1 Tax=Rubripirellula obstinata TaxID=406547 RepID=A0A5B1CM61_9BACT|nr:transporter [Rubripirellula obstinata]KAA1260443.1 hypothetical protein LF1_29830 [Rubripirellula obstinata]
MKLNLSSVLLVLLAIGSPAFVFAQDDDPPFSTSDTNVGYIDSAIPMTQVRVRFDSAFDNPTPDRAEFFYRASTAATGVPLSPAETGVDYQELWSYLELALSSEVSVFVDIPFRFIDPELNPNRSGLGDIQLGMKGVLWSQPNQILSAQLRTYLPTGDADRLLGTDHVSLEPALLYARRLSDRTIIESEFRVWVPINGTVVPEGDFAGSILRFGMGIGHDLYQTSDCCGQNPRRLTAVAEFVGWSILDGLATVPDTPTQAQIIDVSGDTIVNGKFGLRWTDSDRSIFAGYGRSLTGDVWYNDIVRLEYAMRF